MVREINIPENYQLAEAGLIPCEWQAKKLGELFKFKNGVNAEKKQYGKGIKFINVLEVIQKNSLLYDDIPGFISLDPESIKSNIVQKGDVIFNRTSETQEEIGLTAVYLDEQEVVFGGFVIRAKPINDLIDCYFCKYGFSSLTVRNQIIKRGQGAIRANIGQSDLKEVFIPLPPLPEQKAIALSLSDTDALITECDRLITKKRHIKQGTMQQLLTGKKRLPGFSGEWEVKKLGGECELITKGTTPTSLGKRFKNNGINFIKAESLEENGDVIIDKIAFIDYETHSLLKRSQLQENDILVSIARVLGRTAMVKKELLPANTNQALAIARLRESGKITHIYIFYYLKSSLIRKQIDFINVQAAQANLSWENINDLIIYFPSLPEPKAIAQILSDMDAEIAALEQKRDKYKALKQGMMQELLTGKTRLKNNSAD